MYDDPQLPVDGGCLWSGNALDQGSDVPRWNSAYLRFTWFFSVPQENFGYYFDFTTAASFHIRSSSLYTNYTVTYAA